jgi:starvation-inducible DNA-binding protein
MQPKIGITEKHLEQSVHLLSLLLADEMTLYTKTRKFHWNVSGESFMEVHKLFQVQYTELEETIDMVAERISKLGAKSIGTMQEFMSLTRLKENPGINPIRKDMMLELLVDHETVIIELRKDIKTMAEKNGDAGTIDFLTGLMENHETTAWTLRRYID